MLGKRTLAAPFFFSLAALVFGQTDTLQGSDRSGFGFFMGMDVSSPHATLRGAEDLPVELRDSVSTVSSRPRPGLRMGVSYERMFGQRIGFRALAGLSFIDSELEFEYAHGGSDQVSWETARLDLHPQIILFHRSANEGIYLAVGPSMAYDVDEASVLRRTTFGIAGAIGWRADICGLFSIAPELSFAHSLNSSIADRGSFYAEVIDDLRINTVSVRLCFQ